MGSLFVAGEKDNYVTSLPDKNQSHYNELAGIYQWKAALADTFFVKDGKLFDAMTGSAPAADYMVSDSEYMSENDLGKIIFHRNAEGKVDYYSYLMIDGQRVRVPKVK